MTRKEPKSSRTKINVINEIIKKVPSKYFHNGSVVPYAYGYMVYGYMLQSVISQSSFGLLKINPVHFLVDTSNL